MLARAVTHALVGLEPRRVEVEANVVSVGLRGDDLDEWRAHVRIAILIERVSE